MTQNIQTLPKNIVKQGQKAPNNEKIMPELEVYDPETHMLVPRSPKEPNLGPLRDLIEIGPGKSKTPLNIVYQVVYPEDLNLKSSSASHKPKGRPRKERAKVQVVETSPPPVNPQNKITITKTRSGRTSKFPRHIETEFKKIEINDVSPSNIVKVSDFPQYPEPTEAKTDPQELQQPKKRNIAAQYRCPKCKKAYLGRVKMLEHLKKNPTHGPVPQKEENNFEVWNYLVNITQKCPSSERGPKFCQELSNLLHNLLLLTNALFKKLGSAANEVNIDKVLGNAIGLTPGLYYFDDNNLYKDVTVLKLMANTDFLNSIRTKNDENSGAKVTGTGSPKCSCGKMKSVDEVLAQSVLVSEANKEEEVRQNKRLVEDHNFYSPNDIGLSYDFEMRNSSQMSQQPSITTTEPDIFFSSLQSTSFPNVECPEGEKPRPKSPKIKIQSNILICPPNPNYLKSTKTTCNAKSSIIPDLLTDNSVLLSMANERHTVDELMLPLSNETTHLLDNSSSSDEVMNVDQFVNERFRKITESDPEVPSTSSLNLDLTSLDLFHFHTG